MQRLIFLSTIKVNGEGGGKYTIEDMPAPIDDYAKSKYEAELAIKDICHDSSLEYVIIRPPLVYGPGVRANFLRLIRLVKSGLPLPLQSINNLRSLIYCRNLADLLVICLQHSAAVGNTYLVKDIDISTPDLIRAIAEAIGCPARLFPVPVSILKLAGVLSDMRSAVDRLTDTLLIDDAPIRKDLEWEPPYSFKLGLQETVNKLNVEGVK